MYGKHMYYICIYIYIYIYTHTLIVYYITLYHIILYYIKGQSGQSRVRSFSPALSPHVAGRVRYGKRAKGRAQVLEAEPSVGRLSCDYPLV